MSEIKNNPAAAEDFARIFSSTAARIVVPDAPAGGSNNIPVVSNAQGAFSTAASMAGAYKSALARDAGRVRTISQMMQDKDEALSAAFRNEVSEK